MHRVGENIEIAIVNRLAIFTADIDAFHKNVRMISHALKKEVINKEKCNILLDYWD